MTAAELSPITLDTLWKFRHLGGKYEMKDEELRLYCTKLMPENLTSIVAHAIRRSDPNLAVKVVPAS